MKLLLDESLDVRFRHELPGHDVFTVDYLGWKGTKNGELIARAAADGFEVLVTTNRNIVHQQNLTTLPIAIVVLRAPSSAIEDIRPLALKLLGVVGAMAKGAVVEIS